jgi:hypothetical protein
MQRKKNLRKKVVRHLKDDIKMFKDEADEDKELIQELKDKKMAHKKPKKALKQLRKDIKKGKQEEKISDVMHEFKEKKLRSGSKKGPKVSSKKQALAIALREAGVPKKKKKK